MPFASNLPAILAVRENAAEACATQCHSEVDRLITPIDEQETTQERHKHQEAYDLCYSKCVASETEQVAREREQVRPVSSCAAGLPSCCAVNMWLTWKLCLLRSSRRVRRLLRKKWRPQRKQRTQGEIQVKALRQGRALGLCVKNAMSFLVPHHHLSHSAFTT